MNILRRRAISFYGGPFITYKNVIEDLFMSLRNNLVYLWMGDSYYRNVRMLAFFSCIDSKCLDGIIATGFVRKNKYRICRYKAVSDISNVQNSVMLFFTDNEKKEIEGNIEFRKEINNMPMISLDLYCLYHKNERNDYLKRIFGD